MCYFFHGENSESFLSPALMYLCGIHYFDDCVFRKVATSIIIMQ